MPDFSLLDEMAQFALDNSLPVYGIAMFRDGELRERTIVPANPCNDLFSASKSFTATAIGICVDDGVLSLDDNVYDIFKSRRPDMNPKWKQVTVERVISQTVGIAEMFLDIDTEDMFAPPYFGRDWLDVVLDHPFVSEPGERFAYSDSNFYLASRIVSAATGCTMQSLLSERLFEPLKMQGWAWATCPKGFAMGGTGLFLQVRDLAKFGALYLNDGVYDGVRVISAEYARRASSVISNPSDDQGYGLGFWVAKDCNTFRAAGMFSQVAHVDRVHGYVIAWEAHDPGGKLKELWKFVK